jgi:hypothetical protein
VVLVGPRRDRLFDSPSERACRSEEVEERLDFKRLAWVLAVAVAILLPLLLIAGGNGPPVDDFRGQSISG